MLATKFNARHAKHQAAVRKEELKIVRKELAERSRRNKGNLGASIKEAIDMAIYCGNTSVTLRIVGAQLDYVHAFVTDLKKREFEASFEPLGWFMNFLQRKMRDDEKVYGHLEIKW